MSSLLEPLVLGYFDARQIELMVGWLPKDIRALLAQGPIPEDHPPGEGCRVCAAFRPVKLWAAQWLDAHPGLDLDAPIRWSPARRRHLACVLTLAYWHQGEDLERFGLTPGTGSICFERCLMMYRAAGWPG